jgi:hypothetical protein
MNTQHVLTTHQNMVFVGFQETGQVSKVKGELFSLEKYFCKHIRYIDSQLAAAFIPQS